MDFQKCAEIMIKIASTDQSEAYRHPWFKNSPPGIVDWLKPIKHSYLLGNAIRYAKSKWPDKDFKSFVKENLPPDCPGLANRQFRRWLRSI